MTKLQSVKNAAAQSISKSGMFDNITPILLDLHCMVARPSMCRYQNGDMVHKCLHGLVPLYLIQDSIGYQYPRRLVGGTYGLQTHARLCNSLRRPLWTTGRDISPFLNPTCGTASQPNCWRSRVLLLFAGNWKHTYSVCDCSHARLWFRTNLRAINV